MDGGSFVCQTQHAAYKISIKISFLSVEYGIILLLQLVFLLLLLFKIALSALVCSVSSLYLCVGFAGKLFVCHKNSVDNFQIVHTQCAAQ